MFTACTIVSKNYLAYARVLAESFRAHHPDGRFVVLLVDRIDGHFDADAEPFEVLEIEQLADRVDDLAGFLFQYTLLEANTAIKPTLLAHLFDQGADPLIYFDPDILIARPLDRLRAALDDASVVLTPHLTAPIDDDHHPDELAILQAGTYNLGFVALRSDDVGRALVAWWADRLRDCCIVRIEDGLFVDQKWMDLAPGLHPGVRVLRDPGHNVAYWNLHGRTVLRDGDAAVDDPAGYRVVDRAGVEVPLAFFHFSGIDPDRLGPVSKHQDRFQLDDLGDAADLYRLYRDRVLAAGHADCRPWPYAFARFRPDGLADRGAAPDGPRIPDVARRLYLDQGARRARFGDPFALPASADRPAAGSADDAAASDANFYAWLQQPAPGGRLSRLLVHLHALRPDLQRLYPDPGGRDRADFGAWAHEFGRHEWRLDPPFLAGLPSPSRADLLT
ncbi:MAG: hypothetical protein AAF772_14285, partial [Acidobacteriota bacterium]